MKKQGSWYQATLRFLNAGQLQHLESAAPTVCRIPAFASDTNCKSKDIRTGKDLEKIMPCVPV